ncbi:MAG: beta-N-acetylhexosaminidase, partial [Candidatus Omnitrophica bacterium]|nr:beta-N-acetylhexosaminidase [Candidatus Omnitrophota bacterium]
MVGPNQAGSSGEYILLPKPRRIQFLEGHYACSEKSVLTIEGVDRDGTRLFEKIWNHLFPPGGERPATHLRIDPASIIHKDGYRLLVDQNGVWVTARDNAGLYYGLMTLRQLQRQASPSPLIPNVHIEDWPDFPSRGVLLDISRDKVPEMETLYRLVDLLSEWKINQLQLYTEHTFAYRNHPVVWQDASPMTPHQIRALDAYCQEHFILLVPNQNSFGHMERWLKHERYLPLAEMPEGGMD